MILNFRMKICKLPFMSLPKFTSYSEVSHHFSYRKGFLRIEYYILTRVHQRGISVSISQIFTTISIKSLNFSKHKV